MAEEVVDDPDRGRYARDNRDAIYKMLAGENPGSLAEQVRVLGGTRAAAEAAGVTQRTIQRYITTRGTQRIKNPRAETRQALNTAFTQARNTREGRQRIADGRRATLMRHNGAKMKGKAMAGPVTPGGDRGYFKKRNFDTHVDAATMDTTYQAYIEHGEDAAFSAFNKGFGDEYGQGGLFFDEFLFTDMSGLGFTPDVDQE